MRRLCGLFVFSALLGAQPSWLWAQDHLEDVKRIRRELTARGVIPAGIVNPGNNERPCGVHEITRRVAWALRAEGWGLLEKSSGNHCEWKGQRYSMDFVVMPDGRSVDIAVGGDFDGVTTDAAPAWHVEMNANHIGRWRPPIDPEDAPAPVPTPGPIEPTPAPAPPPVVVPSSDQLNRIEAKLDAIKEDTGEIRAGMNRALKFAGKYIAPVVGALVAGFYMPKPEETK